MSEGNSGQGFIHYKWQGKISIHLAEQAGVHQENQTKGFEDVTGSFLSTSQLSNACQLLSQEGFPELDNSPSKERAFFANNSRNVPGKALISLTQIKLPDLAKQNIRCPIKFKFHINNKWFLSMSMSHILFGIYKKLFICLCTWIPNLNLA
jgi:hypothetical protein